MPAPEIPDDWSRWRNQIAPRDYDERFRRLADSGHNVHGEADFVCRYAPGSVLDAGCGTGRVAQELARRGVRVLGVDADRGMIGAARQKAPELAWSRADLASFRTDDRFDVVVLAGNVVPYVEARARAAAVSSCAGALVPGGRLIAGFSLLPGWPTRDDYAGWCTDAGLELEDHFSSWDGDPYQGGDYLLAVYRRPSA
jgi:SAM-dependent methyltransferase